MNGFPASDPGNRRRGDSQSVESLCPISSRKPFYSRDATLAYPTKTTRPIPRLESIDPRADDRERDKICREISVEQFATHDDTVRRVWTRNRRKGYAYVLKREEP